MKKSKTLLGMALDLDRVLETEKRLAERAARCSGLIEDRRVIYGEKMPDSTAAEVNRLQRRQAAYIAGIQACREEAERLIAAIHAATPKEAKPG
jgi:hypothetical protein